MMDKDWKRSPTPTAHGKAYRTGRQNLKSFRGGTTDIPVYPVKTYFVDPKDLKRT